MVMPSSNVIAVGLVSYTVISVVGGLIIGKLMKGRAPRISSTSELAPGVTPDITFASGSVNAPAWFVTPPPNDACNHHA